MSDDNTTVAMPILKIISAWAMAFGLKSWGDVASFLAALYTLVLIGEWVYKKLKPLFKRGRK